MDNEKLLAKAQEHWGQMLTVIKWMSPRHGRPMFEASCAALADGKCSIYQTRPGACRDYDCRDDRARWSNEESPQCAWPRLAVGEDAAPGGQLEVIV